MPVGATGMAASHSFALSIAATVVLALGMGTANGAAFRLVPQELPEAVGGAAGLVGGPEPSAAWRSRRSSSSPTIRKESRQP